GFIAASLPPALCPPDRCCIPDRELPRGCPRSSAALDYSDHANPQIVRITHCSPLRLEKATESYSRRERNPLESQKVETALNPANAASAPAALKTVKEAAHALGLEMLFLNASTPAEIDAAFAALARERAEALFIAGDALFTSRAVQLGTLAVRDRIPASYSAREMVEAGLLMSYGTSFVDTWRQVGVYTGSILKGAKPAGLPVLQSTKFELALNLRTARSFGLDIPPTLLARADEVIE